MTDPALINFLRYDSQLTTSGQPSGAQLRALKALGVDHVINLALHTHEQALPDEAASLAALGITYTHIPVAFDNPTEADFDAFCGAMAAAGNKALHVHCIMNWRVTAFLYRYQRDVLGVEDAQARAQMERVWNPVASDDPRARVWAEFIARKV